MLYLHRCTTHYADCQLWTICSFFQGRSCLFANCMRVTLGSIETRSSLKGPLWWLALYEVLKEPGEGHQWALGSDVTRKESRNRILRAGLKLEGIEIRVIKCLMWKEIVLLWVRHNPRCAQSFSATALLLVESWNESQISSLKLKKKTPTLIVICHLLRLLCKGTPHKFLTWVISFNLTASRKHWSLETLHMLQCWTGIWSQAVWSQSLCT